MIFENVYNRVKVIDFHQDLIIANKFKFLLFFNDVIHVILEDYYMLIATILVEEKEARIRYRRIIFHTFISMYRNFQGLSLQIMVMRLDTNVHGILTSFSAL